MNRISNLTKAYNLIDAEWECLHKLTINELKDYLDANNINVSVQEVKKLKRELL